MYIVFFFFLCIEVYVYSVNVVENVLPWVLATPIFLSKAKKKKNLCLRKSLRKWLLLFFKILHVIIIFTILIEREDASFFVFWRSVLWKEFSIVLFYLCSTFLPFKCQLRHLEEDRLLNKVHYFFQIFPVKIVEHLPHRWCWIIPYLLEILSFKNKWDNSSQLSSNKWVRKDASYLRYDLLEKVWWKFSLLFSGR